MILIVGGAGYIGSHVNKELTKHRYATLVYDNLIYGHRELVKYGEFLLGDTSDLETLKLAFQTYSIRAVIHLAAFSWVGESMSNPQKYYTNNVRNTINLLQMMLEHHVKYFVFSSSCAVYGTPVEAVLTESHLLNPINPYGKSKWMVETILEDYSRAYDLKYIALRYFNAAGADPDLELGEWHTPETHLIPLILDTAIGRKPFLPVYGTDYDTPDGTCVRDYIHVTDIARAHVLAMEYLFNGGVSGAFNLSTEKGASIQEVLSAAQRVTGKSIPIQNEGRRPGDPPMLVGRASKARKHLQWSPEHTDLNQIVHTAWQWHQKLWK